VNFSQKQGIIIGVAAILVLALAILIFANLKKGPNEVVEVELTVWGVDDKKAFDGIIAAYAAFRPNVAVQYVQVDKDRYEQALLNALAAGEGPDVFLVDNNALLRQIGKMTPVLRTQYNLVNLRDSREGFPDVVEDDFVKDGEIYALPLYVDTLALAYNKELFNQASVVFPPGTWQDFQGTVQVLRKVDPSGRILQAGAAIGGSDKSISNAQDVLYLLMVQNGAPMVNDNFSSANFGVQGGLGLQAFNFYSQFANAASPYYTWNDSQPEFLESFARGETAMIFAYKSELDSLRSKNPFLDFRVAFVPQPAGESESVAYANYKGLTVSKQSQVSNWAWDFIIHATTKPEVVSTYLSQVNLPPALNSLINDKINDEDLRVFVRQALTAKSWPQSDDLAIDEIFSQAIRNVLTGQLDSQKALSQAESLVTQLMKER